MNLPVTLRRWMAVGLIVGATVLTTSVLLAKPGVVKTKTGHTYYGDVNKADDGTVTVTIRGVEKKIPQEEVDSVSEHPGDFAADYNARRTKLDPKDVAGRIELSQFALDNGEYVMAFAMASEAQQLDPNNQEVKKLLTTISAEQHASRARGLGRNQPKAATTQSGGTTPPGTPPALPPEMTPKAPPSMPPNTPPPSSPHTPENPTEPGGAAGSGTDEEKPAAPAGPAAPGERRLLTADDIQKIRRFELKHGDTARIQIPQDVRRNFVSKNALNFSQFSSKPAVEQALEILDKGDDDMKEKVRILSDPEAITQFKGVQRNIVQGCATNNCHGPQTQAGNFVLYSPDSDPATYTNFYILQHTSKKVPTQNTGGPFGGPAERQMIERGNGAQSLLAQYALPPARSEHPHPKAANYRGIYSGVEDGRYKKLIDWMNNVLRPVPSEPDYRIDYPMPGHDSAHHTATTKPATTQSTRGG